MTILVTTFQRIDTSPRTQTDVMIGGWDTDSLTQTGRWPLLELFR